jgi:hypothetical protein
VRGGCCTRCSTAAAALRTQGVAMMRADKNLAGLAQCAGRRCAATPHPFRCAADPRGPNDRAVGSAEYSQLSLHEGPCRYGEVNVDDRVCPSLVAIDSMPEWSGIGARGDAES